MQVMHFRDGCEKIQKNVNDALELSFFAPASPPPPPCRMTAPATNDAGDDETTTMTTIKNDGVALAGSFLVGAAVSAALLAWKSSKSAKTRQNGVFIWSGYRC